MVGSIIRAILSKWFFITYFALGLMYFFAFPQAVAGISWGKSFYITLALMTASDPYSFKELIEPHGFLWIVAWLIHIASWLLIPALIALLITEAKEEIKQDQRMDKALGNFLFEEGRNPERAKQLRKKFDQLMEGLSKTGEPPDPIKVIQQTGSEVAVSPPNSEPLKALERNIK